MNFINNINDLIDALLIVLSLYSIPWLISRGISNGLRLNRSVTNVVINNNTDKDLSMDEIRTILEGTNEEA